MLLPSPLPVLLYPSRSPLPLPPAPSCPILYSFVLRCPVLSYTLLSCTLYLLPGPAAEGRKRRASSDSTVRVCCVVCIVCVCAVCVLFLCCVCVCCVTLCVSMQGPAGGGGAAAGDDGVRGRQRRPEAALLGLGPGGRAAAADGRAAASGPVRGPNLQFGIPAAVPRPLAGVPCLRFGPLLLGPVKDASKETAPQADRTGVA